MGKSVEVRFRVGRGPFSVIAAAARLRGMTVTAFYQHVMAKELEVSGDHARLTESAAPYVMYDTCKKLGLPVE